MKKSILAILSFTFVTVAASATTALTLAQAETTETVPSDVLVSPLSYEEYLPLTAPTDVAVNGDYTAVADGNLIYVYDRADNEYSVFTHEEQGAVPDAIKQLQFGADKKLYFSDNSSGDNFYALDLDEWEKTKITNIACSAFVINGLDMYFANSTGALYFTDLSSYEGEKVALDVTARKCSLAFWNNQLYFTDNGTQHILYKMTHGGAKPTQVATFEDEVTDIAITADVFTCTTEKGDFLAYTLPNFTEESLHTHETEGYVALTHYGHHVYAVRNNTVRQYSVTDFAFTSYEICAQSPSVNRLSDAAETLLVGDILYTADNGNSRVSVYNVAQNAYASPISVNREVRYLAANKTTLLAADDKGATLYDLTANGYGKVLNAFDGFSGNIAGIAEVYGKYYLVTADKQFYCVSFDETWQLSQPATKAILAPKALASDAHSNLYVLTEEAVLKYTEADFLSNAAESEKLSHSLSTTPTKLSVDYHGNVYALAQNVIHNLTKNTQTAFETPLVYADSVNVTSFTFHIEHTQAYVLCDGNYLLSTQRLQLPTVKEIAVSGADESVFAQESASFDLVSVKTGALLVNFDIHALQGATYFPYLETKRAETDVTALKIGETDEYALLAIFHKETNGYTTGLTLKSYCETLPDEEYRKEYAEEEKRTGYLTNAISLFKFPYLTDLLIAGTLPQGGQVTVIGEIDKLDYAYYHIAYTTADGQTATGYVPKAYVSPYDGLAPDAQTKEFGETASNSEAEWRFAYLLLGFAAVCILTDYLILRKKDNE